MVRPLIGDFKVYQSFVYPTWANNDDSGVDQYALCGNPSYYIENNFPQVFQYVNGTKTKPLSCKEALSGWYQPFISQDTTVNPFPPPDDPDYCCNAQRYRTDVDIAYELSASASVTLNIENEYGAEAEEFVRLCEELWACSSYSEQYSRIQCELSSTGRGCSDYVGRSLCFTEAYDPDEDSEIDQRKSFIIESCLGAGKYYLYTVDHRFSQSLALTSFTVVANHSRP